MNKPAIDTSPPAAVADITPKLKVRAGRRRKNRVYARVKNRTVGLPPSQRVIDKFEKNANQWTITPKQIKFAELWLEPYIDTERNKFFGNAYTAAIEAGFSDSYARRITSNAEGLEWVKEARKRLVSLRPLHTLKALENEAVSAKDSRDRIRALELVGKIQGLFIDRSIQQVDVQFTNAVPRPTSIPVESTQKPSEPLIEQ